MGKEIFIITDYRGFLFLSLPDGAASCSLDVDVLSTLFRDTGYTVTVASFATIKWDRNYNGVYVIYASSETPGLLYKSYIEDILLNLKRNGAILLPEFRFFRCHHNKVFMEMTRESFTDPALKTIRANYYGAIRELDESDGIEYPVVLKLSAGSGSAGIFLAKSKEELIRIAKKYTKVKYKTAFWKWYRTNPSVTKLKLRYRQKRNISRNEYEEITEKFVVTNFIKGLKGDYKVLSFSDKYYVLYRENRENDFRASGSGKFVFPEETSDDVRSVLDFAKRAYAEIHTPICSIDIAFDGEKCHLMEFQCLYFGPYTLQYSKGWFEHISGEWKYIKGRSVLEKEYFRAFHKYIEEVHDSKQ